MNRPSYEKIDYRLRPAKAVERKMLLYAFSRLGSFDRLENFRYIGMGSVYFHDFILFHRALGINKMISLEGEEDVNRRTRFRKNKPYDCVDLRFIWSTKFLTEFNRWKNPVIAWLDYDFALTKTVLDDIELLCNQVASGSVVLFTVDAEQKRFQDESKKIGTVQGLEEKIGKEHVPSGLDDADLEGWGLASLCRDIIHNEIEEKISARLDENSQSFNYKQLINFTYQDGARMMTVGGIIYKNSDRQKFENCGFSDFEFYRPEREPYHIEIPQLTFREIRKLNTRLPATDLNKLVRGTGIVESDVEAYSRIYRYFPTFSEVDV